MLTIPNTSTEVSNARNINCDNSSILLLNNLTGRDHFVPFTIDGYFLPSLNITAHDEPRWSRLEPDELFYIKGNQLFSSFVGSSYPSIVKYTFEDYIQYTSDQGNGVRGFGESDLSFDNDHLVLCGQKADGTREVFVFEISTRRIIPPLLKITGLDGLKITYSNGILISGDGGIAYYNKFITSANGHAAPLFGRDAFLWCNSKESPITVKDFPNGVILVDINSGAQTGLISFPWDYAFHISTCQRDFFIVSCYAKTLPMQIWQVWFDGKSKILFEDAAPWNGDYNSQPKASLSQDGTKCSFTLKNDTVIIDIPSDISYPGFHEITRDVKKRYLIELNSDHTFREFELN